MKIKLLLTMLIGLSFSTICPNFLSDIIEVTKEIGSATINATKDSAKAIKEATWDAPIGKVPHGGKIIIGSIAIILIADQIYCWHVNKKYRKLLKELSNHKSFYDEDEFERLQYQ